MGYLVTKRILPYFEFFAQLSIQNSKNKLNILIYVIKIHILKINEE